MRLIHPVSRKRLVRAGVTCALVGVLGIVPWQVVARSAGAEKILFVSDRAGAKKLNIFTMNPDGSEPVNLTKSDAMELDPTWSPDRARIAFTVLDLEAKTADIYVMKGDGTERSRLTHSEAGSYACSPSWTPDGKQIAYSILQRRENDTPPQGTLRLIDVDGKNDRKLGDGLQPVWSLDGKKLAYLRVPEEKHADVPSLHIRDADGSNEKTLDEKGIGGAWSPDGGRLVYSSDGGDNQPDLFVVNADGSKRTQLTHTPEFMEVGPQWSADGKRIFFTRFEREKSEGSPRMQVCVMDADGSNVKQLTQGDAISFVGSGAGLFYLIHAIEHGR